jgi:hypothetical protein
MRQVRPFGLLVQDQVPLSVRGYAPQHPSPTYDPKTQTVPEYLVRHSDRKPADGIYASGFLGDSSPTTWSQVSSTGLFNEDSDSGTDDEGTD